MSWASRSKRLGGLLAAVALSAPGTASAQAYRFPIELPASGTQPYITAYRDHNTAGGIQDWNCGTTTYNGHKGTDIGIGSFPVMDAGSRWVVAAAPGKVVFTNDGCFDRCTTADCGCGSGFGNYVKVEHADGKSTYYAHLMKGSLTVKNGDSVSCGQHLGKVGSSGNSTGPHLHFEVRYASNTSDDPYTGTCSGPTSFWVNQGPYKGLPGDSCEKPPAVEDSKLVSVVPAQSVVTPGQSFEVTLVFENTGNTDWTAAANYGLKHTAGDSFGFVSPMAVTTKTTPTQTASFSLQLTAPTTPGAFAGSFRVAKGNAGFGETAALDVSVEAGVGGAAGAAGSVWGSGGSVALGGGAGDASGGKPSGQQTQTLSSGNEGGCGCRTTGNSGRSAGVWLLVVAALTFRRRRRCAA
jgi:MYXO-CTERM domain-containing protein